MKYLRVVDWSADGGGIRLQMLGEDDATHQFEVSRDCALMLSAALAAEGEKLEAADTERQFIRPTSMQTGKTGEGEPLIVMLLKGGTELPLVFKRESLGVIISELEKLRDAIQPGSQMRWQ